MEDLTKSVQRAQAAVLDVQNALAPLRTHVDDKSDECTPSCGDAPVSVNPYYVELQETIQGKQEAATHALQHCVRLCSTQFESLEAKAARLGNVREREKELDAAKKSMRRYFDAHARELEEVKENHQGELQLEWERRHHLEDGAVRLHTRLHHQRLAHGALMTWMKEALVRNVAREYIARRAANRTALQTSFSDALAKQQQKTAVQRILCTWRLRNCRHRLVSAEDAAVESEKRVQFFRSELTAAQTVLQNLLSTTVKERDCCTLTAAHQEKVSIDDEEEMQRLRTALRETTLEFSERTTTYIQQQESLEQLFAQKESAMREVIHALQTTVTTTEQAHSSFVVSSGAFLKEAEEFWKAHVQQLEVAFQRKEDYVWYTLLGLVGRSLHHQRTLQQEVGTLTKDVNTLAPLSERCVRLEGELAEAEQLLKLSKTSSQKWERRCKAYCVVEELLTDRVARADSEALRGRYFMRWLQCSHAGSLKALHTQATTLSDAMQAERKQHLLHQQKQSARHEVELAQLREELEQLRRANVRLQADMEHRLRVEHQRDTAMHECELRNADLSAAVLREKMERRATRDQWEHARITNVVAQEAQERLYREKQEAQWWSVLYMREAAALKVAIASAHFGSSQLTALCEGWQQHCEQQERDHALSRTAAAARTASALEHGVLQVQTLAVWIQWRTWARERRAVGSVEARAAALRKELLERHGVEVVQMHAAHDRAMEQQRSELMSEKAQLQSIHQERCAALRRSHAAELELVEVRCLAQLHSKVAQNEAALEMKEVALTESQAHLEELGAVVVEYCAQATFYRWRCWAIGRRAQRVVRQWHGCSERMAEYQSAVGPLWGMVEMGKMDLWIEAALHVTREGTAATQRRLQQYSQDDELRQGQLRKLQAAKVLAEEEVSFLRSELQHVRTLHEAETQYAEHLLHNATVERSSHRNVSALMTHFGEWREVAYRTAAQHLEGMTTLFADEVVQQWRAIPYSAVLMPLPCVERSVLTRTAPAGGVISCTPGAVLHPYGEASATAGLEEQALTEPMLCAREASASVACVDSTEQLPSIDIKDASPAALQIIPVRLVGRLRSLEAYVRACSSTPAHSPTDAMKVAGGAEDPLVETFLDAASLATSTCSTTMTVSAVVEVDDVLSAVLHLLEIVRLAAVRRSTALSERHTEALASIQATRACSEGALMDLQEDMRGLLTEQRWLAGEMHEETERLRQEKEVVWATTRPEASPMIMETWEERLEALTTRYARVLDGFYDDITRRQGTFYTVNGILTEVDTFSEALLQRFADNAREIAQLRPSLRTDEDKVLPDQGVQHQTVSCGTSPVKAVGGSSPHPTTPQTPSSLSPSPRALGGVERVRSAVSELSVSPMASYLSGGASPAVSTAERRELRDRVHLLERLLVETKVQLAEAKSLLGVAQRAASLAPVSQQAQEWAARDAVEFRDLALEKESMQRLYTIAETTTVTLTSALRQYKAQQAEIQHDMAQQAQASFQLVKDTLQVCHQAFLENCAMKSLTLMEFFIEATRQQTESEIHTREELTQQHRAEAARLLEKCECETGRIRESWQAEVELLKEQRAALEEELQRCRRTTEESVKAAVERQTELLTFEYARKLRVAEKAVLLQTNEKIMVEDRLNAVKEDCERRVQQERSAVMRLQRQLEGCDGGDSGGAQGTLASLSSRWVVYVRDTAQLLTLGNEEKTFVFAESVVQVVDEVREGWETEMMHLRERLAVLLDRSDDAAAPPMQPARPSPRVHCADASSSHDRASVARTFGGEGERSSSQSLSPSPHRTPHDTRTSTIDDTSDQASWAVVASHTPQRTSSTARAVTVVRSTSVPLDAAQERKSTASPDETPTRHRSRSLDSLELSQSLLRYSKMLSEQRTRNEGRLERASALAAEVDDLLLRSAHLERIHASPNRN